MMIIVIMTAATRAMMAFLDGLPHWVLPTCVVGGLADPGEGIVPVLEMPCGPETVGGDETVRISLPRKSFPELC